MLQGLSNKTSVGRFGRFKEDAGNRTVALNTCVAHAVTLYTFGKQAKLIGEPALGSEYRSKITRNNWCGRSIELTSRGEKQQVDLYTTLPGPLFTPSGRRWGFDWAVGSSFVDIEALPEGRMLHAWGTLKRPPQVLLLHHAETPCLLLTSQRAQSLEIITHEHWWFTFKNKAARIMLVPLLDKNDAPRTKELIALWLDLLAAPPVSIEEEFEYKADAMRIVARARSEGGQAVRACPIPPMASLLGDCALQSMDAGTRLLTGYQGPYCVRRGHSEFSRTIQLDWIKAHVAYTRAIEGKLEPLPRELVYAGDISWDEKYPMDALLSLRVWAPLAEHLPPEMWAEIKRRVKLPTPQSLRKTLQRYCEPSVKQVWSKDKTLFLEWGEVSYDTDWYTGLTLSGMWRAAQCSDPQIAGPAQKLFKGLKKERHEMTGYCRIFSDWAFDGAFTDPRGEGYDYDCSHNGIEGILAEAQMRNCEGDLNGRDLCYYIAARFAVCFLASYPLADLQRERKWMCTSAQDLLEGSYGLRAFRERWGAWILGARSKSWPPLFPEYCQLLKKYGPLDLLKRLTKVWEEKVPERYSDWLLFYVGKEVAEKVRAAREDASAGQENREQAGVFYHVEPDVMLRLWVLGQDPTAVERLFKTPLPSSAQMLCRAGATLKA